MSKSVCGSCGAVEAVALEEKVHMPGFGQTGPTPGDGMQPTPGPSMNNQMAPDGAGLIAKRKRAKKRRMHTLGAWDATIPEGKDLEEEEDVDFFICATERKVFPNAEGACVGCGGGCCGTKGLPNLLEIEGMAEEDFGLKVLDSGYGLAEDLFIVHVEREDGRVIEAAYDGSTAEMKGWLLLDETLLSEKSLEDELQIITTDEAINVALKQFEGGEVLAVAADQFEGADAWVVEMTDANGEAVDVYVGLDGTTLGYDVYEKSAEAIAEEEVEEEVTSAEEEVVPEEEAPVETPEEEPVEEEVVPEEEVVEEKSLVDASFLVELAELESIALSI